MSGERIRVAVLDNSPRGLGIATYLSSSPGLYARDYRTANEIFSFLAADPEVPVPDVIVIEPINAGLDSEGPILEYIARVKAEFPKIRFIGATVANQDLTTENERTRAILQEMEKVVHWENAMHLEFGFFRAVELAVRG